MHLLVLFALFSSCWATNSSYCINESDIVYDFNHNPSIIGTFLNCLANVQDALIYPGYSAGSILNISANLQINNLISIDELTDIVTFDVSLMVQWTDYRINMPALWNALPPFSKTWGVDITQAAASFDIQGNQAAIWLPDIVFPDVATMQTTAYYIKIYPGGMVRYTQHILISLIQGQFDYSGYPQDEHTIIIQYFSEALNSHQLQFVAFTAAQTPGNSNPPLQFLNAPDGTLKFAQNPVWSLVSYEGGFSSLVFSAGYAPRSTATNTIVVKRKSIGMVLRLAVPILVLSILAVLAYWSDLEDRINITITLLLAVSALYIVVFQIIPMVGYLTTFDKYVLSMFIILSICCMLHMLLVRLRNKENVNTITKWPLREFYIRALEMFSRLCVIPIVVALFVTLFNLTITDAYFNAIIVVTIAYAITVAMREYGPVYRSFCKGINEVNNKLEENKQVSKSEIILYNLHYYKIISIRLDHYNKNHKRGNNNNSSPMHADRDVSTNDGIELQLQ